MRLRIGCPKICLHLDHDGFSCKFNTLKKQSSHLRQPYSELTQQRPLRYVPNVASDKIEYHGSLEIRRQRLAVGDRSTRRRVKSPGLQDYETSTAAMRNRHVSFRFSTGPLNSAATETG